MLLLFLALFAVLLAPACPVAAQTWRTDAAHLGTTARVLLVGTRPEDEDNALIAWLSLGQHVETAYLSLTRGESGINVAGSERQAPLAVVRTAELLAERARDGAHQYFTRAYDFGPTASDSVVRAGWPNEIAVPDFAGWTVARARGLPAAFDPRYAAPLAMADPGERPTAGALLAARVGKGMVVYTGLSLDQQLEDVHPGAARLLVNLLSAGLAPAVR